MRRVGCQIDNARWNVDDHIGKYGSYENACDALGLPHYVPRMDVVVEDDDHMKEIKDAVLSSLSKKHRFEAIDVDIEEVFER